MYDYIRIRDRLELQVATPTDKRIFSVRVQDVTRDGIFIDRPIIDRRLLPLKLGDEVVVVIQRDDATYRFKTRVLEELYLGRLPSLKIEHPKEMERLQHREYFRLDVEMPLLYRLKTLITQQGPLKFERGTVIDLSAGGMRFKSSIKKVAVFRQGDVLQLTFQLTGKRSIIDTDAIVLKISIDEDDKKDGTVICRFLNISTGIQEAIIVHNIRFQKRFKIEPRDGR